MSNNTKQFIGKPRFAKPWLYFVATYAWTWSFFGIAIWLGLSAETGGLLGAGLVLLALSGPAVMACAFVKLALNKKGQQDYWQRIFDYKRISLKWYLAIFSLIPAIGFTSALLSGYWQYFAFVNVTPSMLLTAIVIPFVPLVEELGWRGYVLDRLQENHSALTSSLALGVLWGFWHLPAFFLNGGGLSVLSFGSLAFWEYMGGLTALSVCMTWIYNNTNRSTLSAILFHMVLEFWADTGMFPWNRADVAYHLGVHIGLWAILAVGLTIFYGAKSLAGNKQDNDKNPEDNNKSSNAKRCRPKNQNKKGNDYEACFDAEMPSKYTPQHNIQMDRGKKNCTDVARLQIAFQSLRINKSFD